VNKDGYNKDNDRFCTVSRSTCKSTWQSYYVVTVNVFSVILLYFILWAVVSAGYPALLSSSYFERINDDDDDDKLSGSRRPQSPTVNCLSEESDIASYFVDISLMFASLIQLKIIFSCVVY